MLTRTRAFSSGAPRLNCTSPLKSRMAIRGLCPRADNRPVENAFTTNVLSWVSMVYRTVVSSGQSARVVVNGDSLRAAGDFAVGQTG